MNQATINTLKSRLVQIEDELRSDIEFTSAEANSMVRDLESRAETLVSQHVAIELKARQEMRLQRVQNALKSIAKGTYGKCRKCGTTISVERLQIQPETFLCIRCAT